METDRLRDILSRMMYRDNYWGYVFSKVKRIRDDSYIAPFGVSCDRNGVLLLYYNWNMVSETVDNNIEKFLEHEGSHFLNRHLSRLLKIREVDPDNFDNNKMKICNIAADSCVNTQAKLPRMLQVNSGEYPLIFPDLYKLPPEKNMEFYYYTLLKQQKKNQKNGNGTGGHGQGSSKSEELSNLSHSGWPTDIPVDEGSGLARKIDYNTSKICREAFKNVKDRGNLPGYISELINGLLEPPKAPYYQIIRQLVRGSRLSKFIRSFTRLNRKRMYSFYGLVNSDGVPLLPPFPGKTRNYTFNIAIMIDTSMSQSQIDIKEALSGIKDIIENDPHCHVNVLEVDTQIQKEYRVKQIRDIQFNVKGRGGTYLRPGLERAKELNSDVTLCFTDGYCEDVNSIPRMFLPKNIIWIIPERDGTFGNVDRSGVIVKI